MMSGGTRGGTLSLRFNAETADAPGRGVDDEARALSLSFLLSASDFSPATAERGNDGASLLISFAPAEPPWVSIVGEIEGGGSYLRVVALRDGLSSIASRNLVSGWERATAVDGDDVLISDGSTIKKIDGVTGAITTLDIPFVGSVRSLETSGGRIVVGGGGPGSTGHAVLIDRDAFEVVDSIDESLCARCRPVVSPGGRYIVFPTDRASDGTIIIDTQTKVKILPNQSWPRRVRAAVFSPDGSKLLLAGHDPFPAVLITVGSWQTAVFSPHSLQGKVAIHPWGQAVAFSKNGQKYAIATSPTSTAPATIRAGANTYDQLAMLDQSLTFIDDERIAWRGAQDINGKPVIHIAEAEYGQYIRSIPGAGSIIATSEDGSRLISAGSEKPYAILYETREWTRQPLLPLPGPARDASFDRPIVAFEGRWEQKFMDGLWMQPWNMFGVAAGSDLWVAVGVSQTDQITGQIYARFAISPDLQTWTSITGQPGVILQDVASDGQRWVAVGPGAILTSGDGAVWVQRASSGGSAVATRGGVWVTCAFNGVLRVSIDSGMSWMSQQHATNDHMTAIAVNDSGQWVIGTSNGTLYVSDTGVDWLWHDPGFSSGVTSLAWAGQKWLAMTQLGDVYMSENRAEWRQVFKAPMMSRLAGDGERFAIASVSPAAAWNSVDGEAWEESQLNAVVGAGILSGGDGKDGRFAFVSSRTLVAYS